MGLEGCGPGASVASNVQRESIMVKSFASTFGLAGLLGSVLIATSVVVACGSSSDSTFTGDPPKPDAEPDAPGSLVGEGGLGPPDAAEAGPTSCPPAIPAGWKSVV